MVDSLKSERNPASRAAHVVMLAHPSAKNPYITLLIEALERSGASIVALGEHVRFLRTVLRKRPIAAVHVHWLSWLFHGVGPFSASLRSFTFLLQLLLLRAAGVRVIWTVHNLVSHDARYPRLEKRVRMVLARLSTAVIVHCERAAYEVREFLRIRGGSGKVEVIPHGNYIDCYPRLEETRTARQALGLEPETFTIVFLGKIRQYKGLEDLFEAYSMLSRERKVQLVVAGEVLDPEYGSELERRSAELPSLHWMPGFVEDETAGRLMASADVVVAPYRKVLTSGTVVLAMSLGRPVVAPAAGCIPELLGEEGGFLYEASDPTGLLRALRTAVDSKDRLVEMGTRNLERVRVLTWSRIARSTRELYGV